MVCAYPPAGAVRDFREPSRRSAASSPRGGAFAAVIFDIDGVVLDTPHEEAWRLALEGLAPAHRFTSVLYRDHVAGRPRLDGARSALEALGVPDAAALAPAYARRKQDRLEALLAERSVQPFPDALRLISGLSAARLPLAAASSSRNAGRLLDDVELAGRSVRSYFVADLCGQRVRRGKPHPDLFLAAARAVRTEPRRCLVIEDAPSGVMAARRAGCVALGVARDGDQQPLEAAGADLVVSTLDALDLSELGHGRLALSGR